MAYIQPHSNIYVLKDVPLNPSYDDTFTFKNKEEQYNYFINKVKFELVNYSIVRERTNALRVEGDIGEYYDVNYLMFQNDNFSDKWFYAFIVDVQYINPNTTLIVFQLDVMQSWMFDYTILPSLVEREHVYDDSLYANLIPEGIQVNERIAYSQPNNLNNFIGQKIMVLGFTENNLNFVHTEIAIPYDPKVQEPDIETIYRFDVFNISRADIIIYNKNLKQFEFDDEHLQEVQSNGFTFKLSYNSNGGSGNTDITRTVKITCTFDTTTNQWMFDM